MLAEGKRRKRRKSTSSNLPAPAKRRRTVRTVTMMPAKRRRKRKPGMMSAGSPMGALLMQGGLAMAGGVAGKIVRNAMPADMNPYLKAAISAAGGVVLAYVAKQPMLGAGMIGSAGASIAANIGKDYKIPILSEQSNANFVRLMENREQFYVDAGGRPLKRIGNQFYNSRGQLTSFTETDFRPIN